MSTMVRAAALVAGLSLGFVAAAQAASQPLIARPVVHNGVLTVTGTSGADAIALRLQTGNARIVQVDVGDDGTADFTSASTTATASSPTRSRPP